MSGRSRQHTEVAVAVDARWRHQSGEAVEQFQRRQEQRSIAARTGLVPSYSKRLPVTSFLAETAHQITVMADNLGYGERFVPRLVDVLRKVNGL